LQIELNRLGEWAVENAVIINPAKRKAVCFTRFRVTEPINYSLWGRVIPEASSCKYYGIILRSDIIWADSAERKAGRHFILQFIFLKEERVALKCILHITSASDT
jgi:hypothetical protein